jgi:hypothetical protein
VISSHPNLVLISSSKEKYCALTLEEGGTGTLLTIAVLTTAGFIPMTVYASA